MRTEDEAKVLDLMVQEGEEPGTLTYNVVVNGLCKEDRVDDALRVVEMMAKKGKKPDVVTYNTLLKGLCGAAKIDEAMELWTNDDYLLSVCWTNECLCMFLHYLNTCLPIIFVLQVSYFMN